MRPSPAGRWLGAETDTSGRVKVGSDCGVPGIPDVFVVGDTAHFEEDGRPLPGVAQVAMQQGDYVGRLIWALVHVAFLPAPGNRVRVLTQWAFSYFTRQRSSQIILGSHRPQESARDSADAVRDVVNSP